MFDENKSTDDKIYYYLKKCLHLINSTHKTHCTPRHRKLLNCSQALSLALYMKYRCTFTNLYQRADIIGLYIMVKPTSSRSRRFIHIRSGCRRARSPSRTSVSPCSLCRANWSLEKTWRRDVINRLCLYVKSCGY